MDREGLLKANFLQSTYLHLCQGDDAHVAYGFDDLTSVTWCRGTWVVPDPEVICSGHAALSLAAGLGTSCLMARLLLETLTALWLVTWVPQLR